MDDLISRKALLAAYNERHKGPPGGARELIEDAPSVPAVQLEPLCQWLAGYAAPPQYAMNAVAGDPIAPTSCGYPVNSRVEAWKYHFRELLKSWLMDTEGEDAEEKA